MKKLFLFYLFIFIITDVSAQSIWMVQNSGTTQNLTRIKSSGTKLWITGKNGTLLSSSDQGSTWQQVHTGFNFHFNDIFITSVTGYIACSGGNILKTTYGGTIWTALNTGITQDINSIAFSTSRIVAVCNGGIILRSTNNGSNWTQYSVNGNDLKSVSYFNSYFVACGSNGTIVRTTNLGNNWEAIPVTTTNNLNFVIHKSTDTIFACGINTLMRSDNGGANWTFISTGHTDNFTSFAYNTQGHYYMTSVSGKVYKKINPSGVWQIDHTSPYPLNYMNGIIPVYGWAVGNNGTLIWPYLNAFWKSYKYIDANNISTPYTNYGNFNRDPNNGNSGFEWPKGENKYARYSSGLWMGAIVDGDTLIAMSEYDYEFFPGYTDNTGNPQGKLDTLNRPYKILADVNDYDRSKWPNALLGNSDQGAPVYFDALSNSWKPLDFGWQTIFTRFTDSYPESHDNRAGSTAPLKADIKSLCYSFAYPSALSNTIITRYTIINRSSKVWNNLYLSFWTDDDVGYAGDDMIACDTNLNLGYTYNWDNNDNMYGIAPPAVGFVMLKGPAVYTGNNNDTSWICNAKQRINKTGFRDRKMDIYSTYLKSHAIYGDPRSYNETYRILQCLGFGGAPVINPITNKETKYWYSGDPVTNTGWVYIPHFDGDQRFLSGTGPVTMNPGDTQYIVFAQIIARGTSNLNSITVLRQYAQEVINYYNNCFSGVPIGIEPISNNIPERYELYQNYPNPFNPVTKIKFNIGTSTPETGKPLSNRNVKLVIYDVMGREVEMLVNEQVQPGKYEVEWDGSKFASGVYYYSLLIDGNVFDSKKMVMIK